MRLVKFIISCKSQNMNIPVVKICKDGKIYAIRLETTGDGRCHLCGNKGSSEKKLKKCGGCLFALYCSAECQKAHRKEHMQQCKSIIQATEGHEVMTLNQAIKAFGQK